MTASVATFQANKSLVDAGTHQWHGAGVWKVPKSQRPVCGAKTRAGGTCKAKAVPGKSRCRLHGGLSTGPKTATGRAAIAEANRRRRKHPAPVASGDTQEAVSAPQPLTSAQERAAILLGIDELNDADIAQEVGVSRRTLARWKNLPAFDARVQAVYERCCDLRAAEMGLRQC